MRLLHAIFKHYGKVSAKRGKQTGKVKPKAQGPKPHHQGPAVVKPEAPGKGAQFDRRSGEWKK